LGGPSRSGVHRATRDFGESQARLKPEQAAKIKNARPAANGRGKHRPRTKSGAAAAALSDVQRLVLARTTAHRRHHGPGDLREVPPAVSRPKVEVGPMSTAFLLTTLVVVATPGTDAV
jgi:hypothetical protein